MPETARFTESVPNRIKMTIVALACVLAAAGFSACGDGDTTTTPGASGATGNVGPANAGNDDNATSPSGDADSSGGPANAGDDSNSGGGEDSGAVSGGSGGAASSGN
jgi:hypothetical protein